MTSNKDWNLAKRLPREVLDSLIHLPPVVAQLLHNRGIKTRSEANTFLHPNSDAMHDPLELPDMQRAITRIEQAMEHNELIGIFGDFDADGVTATAVLALGLIGIGIRILPYIPKRVDEGHGLNLEAIDSLRNQEVSLIITVDCGITSIDEIAYAKTLGIDTIVTDHHSPLDELPESNANINPQIGGHSYPFHGLSGVGLAFKLVQGLYNNLGFDWNTQLLQLVAIGTITDVAPLLDENRYFVIAGLDSLQRDPLPGLKQLLNLSRIRQKDKLDTQTISFSLGPLINAPGRLGDAMKSYNILTSTTEEQASVLAQEIDQINKKRRDMTQQAMEIARTNIGQIDENEAITLVWDEQFTPGIVGLIASRLVDQYARPAIAIAIDGDLARGSARSIHQFNLVSALTKCEDLFTRFGGHPMAGGFTIKTIDLPILKQRLSNIALETLKEEKLKPTIDIDANVRVTSLTGETFKIIQSMEPFGEANAQPTFLTTGVEVKSFQYIGKKKQHLRMKIDHQGSIWDAVAFDQASSWDSSYKTVDLVYTVGIDTWSGKDVFKLYVRDFRQSTT